MLAPYAALSYALVGMPHMQQNHVSHPCLTQGVMLIGLLAVMCWSAPLLLLILLPLGIIYRCREGMSLMCAVRAVHTTGAEGAPALHEVC